MSDADRAKWDARHRERGEPGEPSPFVRSVIERLPSTGRALDVAGGAGRHALLLAHHGLDTTLVDISREALAIARQHGPIHTVERDLDTAPLPTGPFDVVLVFHFLDRRVYRALADVMAPGGQLILVHPTRLNLERHAQPSAAYLLEPGEAVRILPGLEIVTHEEGWLDEGRHEARVIARRPLVEGGSGRYITRVPGEPLVLVVDDYQDSREMYAEYLQLSGFRVVQAADGEEAVRVAADSLPDIVVMDIGLPGVDGREATRRLKANEATSRIPVVIMSGMPPEYARSTGADSYVTKPCAPDALVNEIQRILLARS